MNSATGTGPYLADMEVTKLELLKKINKERELLVQPYIPEISNGELGIVMIEGKIVNINVFGHNNKIKIKNNSQTN